jgi:DNA-binding transcriptional LysR family regulator
MDAVDRIALMTSFVAVAEARSFSAVAAALGLSRALVSRHIADLEQNLGTRLLNRTTRSVNLTAAGQRHFLFCRRLLNELREEEHAIAGLREKPEGLLSVATPKWIGNLQVGDAVAAFALAHPKIQVRCEAGHHFRGTHDFIGAGFDVAFQTRAIRDSSVMAKRIATLDYVLCASPAYLERHGMPQRAAEVARHRALLHVNDPAWHLTDAGRSVRIKPHDVAFSSNTFVLLQKAARAGAGIAMLPLSSVAADLADGTLRRVLPGLRVLERPLYISYAPGSQNVGRVRCFIDYIAAWFKRHATEQALAPTPRPRTRARPKPAGRRRKAPQSGREAAA